MRYAELDVEAAAPRSGPEAADSDPFGSAAIGIRLLPGHNPRFFGGGDVTARLTPVASIQGSESASHEEQLPVRSWGPARPSSPVALRRPPVVEEACDEKLGHRELESREPFESSRFVERPR